MELHILKDWLKPLFPVRGSVFKKAGVPHGRRCLYGGMALYYVQKKQLQINQDFLLGTEGCVFLKFLSFTCSMEGMCRGVERQSFAALIRQEMSVRSSIVSV